MLFTKFLLNKESYFVLISQSQKNTLEVAEFLLQEFRSDFPDIKLSVPEIVKIRKGIFAGHIAVVLKADKKQLSESIKEKYFVIESLGSKWQ